MTASDSRKVQKIVFDVVQDPIPRDCKLPMELSRDILRNMFAERFGYSDLTPNDIDALEGFIAIELARFGDMGIRAEAVTIDADAVNFEFAIKANPTLVNCLRVWRNCKKGGKE